MAVPSRPHGNSCPERVRHRGVFGVRGKALFCGWVGWRRAGAVGSSRDGEIAERGLADREYESTRYSPLVVREWRYRLQ